MIDAVADTVGEMPSRSKYGWLRGSLTRAIVVSTPYFSRASWQMIDVVLVVAGDRDDDVGRALDAGALEHEELGRVALVHLVLELGLEHVVARVALLDQRHLVPGADQRAREVRADLPAACDQEEHLAEQPLRRRARRR